MSVWAYRPRTAAVRREIIQRQMLSAIRASVNKPPLGVDGHLVAPYNEAVRSLDGTSPHRPPVNIADGERMLQSGVRPLRELDGSP